MSLQDGDDAVDRGIELDGPDQRYCLASGEVLCYGVYEMLSVDAYCNEDV